ncbi:hypothetical protein [Longitalea luteola]|uniref:hypothetical protein n=1 Tax=Longitalea luteola TaxID=2812563 RepID=UPI001A9791D1|nr:hypothetical protein [Longitalea luteola]
MTDFTFYDDLKLWESRIQYKGTGIPIRFAGTDPEAPGERGRAENMLKTRALIEQSLDGSVERAKRMIRLFVQESGFYNEDENNIITDFELNSVWLELPLVPIEYLIEYSLDFDIISEAWVDTYGYFKVYFLYNKITGVRRMPY